MRLRSPSAAMMRNTPVWEVCRWWRYLFVDVKLADGHLGLGPRGCDFALTKRADVGTDGGCIAWAALRDQDITVATTPIAAGLTYCQAPAAGQAIILLYVLLFCVH